MKKLLSTVVILTIIISMFSGLTIASAESFPTAPADWEVLLAEDFDAQAGSNLADIVYDAQNPNFSSGWTVTTGDPTKGLAKINTSGQLQMTHH
ncbi:MAG: hypothetical protein PHE51_09720 [Eubacteriales bacterium]|nr:hypothetical protein [Eubacteriales bacterium]